MISIFVPALNEERHIVATLDLIMGAAEASGLREYEILAFDDGSTDATGRLLDEYAAKHKVIRSIHNPVNLGLGASFHEALRLARYEKLTWFAGDNNFAPESMQALFGAVDVADVVTLYFVNTELRSRLRNLLSVMFSTIYLTVFDLHLKYIHGNSIFPVAALRSMRLRSTGYGCIAEAMVKLLRSGVTFHELSGYMNANAEVSSQALRLKTLTGVMKDILSLIYDVYFSERQRYAHRPKRIYPGRLAAASRH